MTEQLNVLVMCSYCGGNDADMPCAYPSEKKKGCLREKRLNQCDGCAQGLPVDMGIHRTKEDEPFMCCTKHLYT